MHFFKNFLKNQIRMLPKLTIKPQKSLRSQIVKNSNLNFFSPQLTIQFLVTCCVALLAVSANCEAPKEAELQQESQNVEKRGIHYSSYGGHDWTPSYGGDHGGHHEHHHEHIKTVTIEKKVPYPVEVIKKIPVTVEKKIPYEVKVPIPQPYEVIKKYPVKVKEYQKYTVEVPKPYEVIKKVPVEVKVPVEKPYPVKVFVPEPYEVIKKVNYNVEKHIPTPYEVIKKVS